MSSRNEGQRVDSCDSAGNIGSHTQPDRQKDRQLECWAKLAELAEGCHFRWASSSGGTVDESWG